MGGGARLGGPGGGACACPQASVDASAPDFRCPPRLDLKTRLDASHGLSPHLFLPRHPPPPSTKTATTVAMFARAAARSLAAPSRHFSSSAARQSKVAVLGAGGGIGQPLSLLLKLNPHVTELSLYDIRGAPGVAADVSHIDTNSEVRLFPSLRLLRVTLTHIHSLLSLRSRATLPTSSTRPSRAPTLSSSLLAFPARFVLISHTFHRTSNLAVFLPARCKHLPSLRRT